MKNLRNDFPIYRNNTKLVYLDYAATTFMPDNVISAWHDFHSNIGVSINRGSGILSDKASEIYYNSKEELLNFFGASSKYDIAFTKNATEGLNLMANTISNFLNAGDYILMSPYEHHSNIIPWNEIAKLKEASIIQFPILDDGSLDYNFIYNIDYKRIKIISLSLISNVTGYLLDLHTIKDIAKLTNAYTILDISQACGHIKLNFDAIDADAFVMSAHKMYGPKNIGACFIKKDLIDILPPFLLGGGMVWNTIGGNIQWHSGARKFDAGTFDIGLIYAWSKACIYLNDIDMKNIQSFEEDLFDYTKDKFNDLSDILDIIPYVNKSSIFSFDIHSIHTHDIAEILSNNNIEIRTGHMCSQNTLNIFNKTSLCRISWGIGSFHSDIDKLVEIIKKETKRYE